MSRDEVARLALHAFPPTVRAAHGEEMLGTLLDVSASSRARFAREIVELVRSGLRERALESAALGARRVIADGVCLAAVWMLTLFLSSDLGLRIHGGEPGYPDAPLPLWSLALLVLALAIALVGYDRIAGSVALLFTATVIVHIGGAGLANGSRGPLLVASLCFAGLMLAPRRRDSDARRLAWLALAAALGMISSTGDDATATVVLLALILLVPPALALLPFDPRLAIACALPTTAFGIRIAHNPGSPSPLGLLVITAILAAAPVVIAIAVARTRRLQARVPV